MKYSMHLTAKKSYIFFFVSFLLVYTTMELYNSNYNHDIDVDKAFLQIIKSQNINLTTQMQFNDTNGKLYKNNKSHRALYSSIQNMNTTAAENVEAILLQVDYSYRDQCRSILTGGMFTFSQAWQDWLLYFNNFKGMGWGGGVYIDIGSNDATFISNTLFFDKCLGWKGICFEPQSQYHNEIRRHRSCELIPHCVLGKAGKVNSRNNGVSFVVDEDMNGNMECVGLDEILRERNIKKVDLVNLDIEGMEHTVLRCFPFHVMAVGSVFIIETNKQDLRQVTLFMNKHSFSARYTVLNIASSQNTNMHSGAWLDNIFVKHTETIFPPTNTQGFECSDLAKHYRRASCQGWFVSRDKIDPKWASYHC